MTRKQELIWHVEKAIDVLTEAKIKANDPIAKAFLTRRINVLANIIDQTNEVL